MHRVRVCPGTSMGVHAVRDNTVYAVVTLVDVGASPNLFYTDGTNGGRYWAYLEGTKITARNDCFGRILSADVGIANGNRYVIAVRSVMASLSIFFDGQWFRLTTGALIRL